MVIHFPGLRPSWRSAGAKEHAFFVLYGTGANGKSTLLAIAAKILGDYGVTASSETFVDRRNGAATNDLVRLRGVRFVSAIETSKNRTLALNRSSKPLPEAIALPPASFTENSSTLSRYSSFGSARITNR